LSMVVRMVDGSALYSVEPKAEQMGNMTAGMKVGMMAVLLVLQKAVKMAARKAGQKAQYLVLP
jgi:hypothetical protein